MSTRINIINVSHTNTLFSALKWMSVHHYPFVIFVFHTQKYSKIAVTIYLVPVFGLMKLWIKYLQGHDKRQIPTK